MKTVREISEGLNVTPLTVYNWIHSGKIEAKKVGNSWRLPDSLLEGFDSDKKEEEKKAPAKPELTEKEVVDFDDRIDELIQKTLRVAGALNNLKSKK